MPTECFAKKGSDPPVCGIHKVRLEPHQSSEAWSTAKYGDFKFLKCPVSGQVIDDPPAQKNS
jgi:hypothetical protein